MGGVGQRPHHPESAGQLILPALWRVYPVEPYHPMPSVAIPAGQRCVPRGWLLASLVACSYFFTSLVVVLNAIGNATGVVWLPSFPAGYYLFSRWLYWPFQDYFALLAPLQANPQISYMLYALISRVPFLLGSAAVMVVATMQWRRSRVASWGHATDTSVQQHTSETE